MSHAVRELYVPGDHNTYTLQRHEEADFTADMLGLDEVLRDAGVDASGLNQMGIHTGPRLQAQPATTYMDDEEMSDAELPEDRSRPARSTYPAHVPMFPGSPAILGQSNKKTKIIVTRRPIERKKSVYEIFPSYTPDRPLDFVDLFGQRAKKPSRIWSKELPPSRMFDNILHSE